MMQKQLVDQVARITGDPLMIIIRLGFNVTSRQPFDLEPEDVQLVLDCPFCGHPVSYPGQSPLAENGQPLPAQRVERMGDNERTRACLRSRGGAIR